MRLLTILLLVCALVAPSLAFQTDSNDPAIKKELKELKQLEKDHKEAKQAYEKNKKSSKLKKKYVDVTFELGRRNMFSPALGSKVKYRTALQYFREVLKTDPNHKEAKKHKKTIEDIYKSLGRPIPGDE